MKFRLSVHLNFPAQGWSAEAVSTTPQEFAAIIRSDMGILSKLIQIGAVKPE